MVAAFAGWEPLHTRARVDRRSLVAPMPNRMVNPDSSALPLVRAHKHLGHSHPFHADPDLLSAQTRHLLD